MRRTRSPASVRSTQEEGIESGRLDKPVVHDVDAKEGHDGAHVGQRHVRHEVHAGEEENLQETMHLNVLISYKSLRITTPERRKIESTWRYLSRDLADCLAE